MRLKRPAWRARLKNETQDLKQERKRLSADYQDFRKSRDAETDRLKSDYQKLKESSDAEIARLKDEIKAYEDAESEFDEKYSELSEEFEAYKADACVRDEERLEKIGNLKDEISALNEQVDYLEEDCGMSHGRISDLENMISALQTQIKLHSSLNSTMQQLLVPVAEYCCQNSEKDRPELEQFASVVVSNFKSSLTKVKEETDTLIQSLSRYHIPDAPIPEIDPVKPDNTPAAGEQPSAE